MPNQTWVLILLAPVLIALGMGGQPEPLGTSDISTPEEQEDLLEADGVTEAVVILTSGRSIEGVLISQNDESVVIQINGIDTTFPLSRVRDIRVLEPVAVRYRRLRDAISDDDIQARLTLVEWLRLRSAFRIAVQELDSILEADPGNPDARLLHTWLTEHIRLQERKVQREPERSEPGRQIDPSSLPTLTPEQINRIRVFETDLSDPPRLIIEDGTIRTLITRHPNAFPADEKGRDAIFDLEPVEKLRLLFEHRARDLYDQVRVLEDPGSMRTFKRRVFGTGGWIANACASNRCHGGAEAGRLRLASQRANSDASAYTSFLILDRFTLADGTPLINHDDPERSPLLQMGLLPLRSLYPHPEVDPTRPGRGFRPVFRGTDDAKYQETVAWITSLYRPRPDYGIEYPPPAHPTPDPEPDAQPDAEIAPQE